MYCFLKYIGEALIGTLEDGLKEEFKPKVKKAWIKVFAVVEAQMKIGMRQAESEAKSPKQIEITINTIHDVDLKNNGNMSNNSHKTHYVD